MKPSSVSSGHVISLIPLHRPRQTLPTVCDPTRPMDKNRICLDWLDKSTTRQSLQTCVKPKQTKPDFVGDRVAHPGLWQSLVRPVSWNLTLTSRSKEDDVINTVHSHSLTGTYSYKQELFCNTGQPCHPSLRACYQSITCRSAVARIQWFMWVSVKVKM